MMAASQYMVCVCVAATLGGPDLPSTRACSVCWTWWFSMASLSV